MSLLDKAGSAPTATEADWDDHKENIRRLYCIEDRELKDVQEEMKRCYAFEADAYQYEKYLKRWKFRKNLKKEEWIPVKQKILARKREGKDSDVYLEGVLMPAKKVKRAVQRYRKADDQLDLFSYDYASMPQTPDGVTIVTPKPMEHSSSIYADVPISHYFTALLHQVILQSINTISPASILESSSDISVPFTSMPNGIPVPPWTFGRTSVVYTAPATGSWIPDLGTEIDDSSLSGLELVQILPEHTEALRPLQFMIFFISNGYLDTASYGLRVSIIKWLRQEDNGPLLHHLLSVGGPTSKSILETLYSYAVEGQRASIVKIFLDLGCDPNVSLKNRQSQLWAVSDMTALGSACEEPNLELVRVLLAAGANPNQLSQPTITQARDFDDDDGVSDHIEGQCPMILSMRGHTTSYFSSEGERHESLLLFIKTLIQSGALVHGASPVRRLPLVEAAQGGFEGVIRLLLQEGADVNLPDGKGRVPLTAAIEHLIVDSPAQTSQSLSIIRLLLSANAGVNTPYKRPRYYDECIDMYRGPEVILPFDMAAERGSLELVKFLYSAGARPSRFALTYAVAGENVDVVKFTLDVGAVETNIPAEESAMIQAIRLHNTEMFRLIFESGAAQQSIDFLSLAVETAISMEKYDIVPQLLVAGLQYPSFADRLRPAVVGAVSSGNVDILDLLLSSGVEANSGVLVQAFNSEHESMIKKILDMGALRLFEDTDDRSGFYPYGTCEACLQKTHCTPTSPMIAAARFGNCDIVKRLLEQGASLTGPEPLVCAIRGKNLDMVTTLLEAGSPINASACDYDSNITPLQAAVRTRQLPLVRILLENGANPDLMPFCDSPYKAPRSSHFDKPQKNMPPLQMAVKLKDREIAVILLQAGADINNPQAEARGCSALSLAIHSKDQQMFEFVLAQGADRRDASALLEAVELQNIPLVKGLLTSGSRAGQEYRGFFGCEALGEAVRQRSMDMVKLLLSHGIDPNKQSHEMTALGVAITLHEGPALEIVETLLEAGADPNGLIESSKSYGSYGSTRTALVAAARTGEVALVSLLIQHGADPDAHPKGAVWRSPLQAACEEGKLRVVQLLLNHNADVNAPAAWHKGGTALQLAAINGHPGIVLALLDRGADMNAPAARVSGRTALEGAAENGRLDTVRALLDAGVGIDGPYEGQYNRALQFAKKNGYLQVQRELVAKAKVC